MAGHPWSPAVGRAMPAGVVSRFEPCVPIHHVPRASKNDHRYATKHQSSRALSPPGYEIETTGGTRDCRKSMQGVKERSLTAGQELASLARGRQVLIICSPGDDMISPEPAAGGPQVSRSDPRHPINAILGVYLTVACCQAPGPSWTLVSSTRDQSHPSRDIRGDSTP